MTSVKYEKGKLGIKLIQGNVEVSRVKQPSLIQLARWICLTLIIIFVK
jgi:hypothetical protein